MLLSFVCSDSCFTTVFCVLLFNKTTVDPFKRDVLQNNPNRAEKHCTCILTRKALISPDPLHHAFPKYLLAFEPLLELYAYFPTSEPSLYTLYLKWLFQSENSLWQMCFSLILILKIIVFTQCCFLLLALFAHPSTKKISRIKCPQATRIDMAKHEYIDVFAQYLGFSSRLSSAERLTCTARHWFDYEPIVTEFVYYYWKLNLVDG